MYQHCTTQVLKSKIGTTGIPLKCQIETETSMNNIFYCVVVSCTQALESKTSDK